MIEKGIPIPGEPEPDLHTKIPDLLLMKVGDSTVVDEREVGRLSHIALAMWGLKRGQRHKMVDLEEKQFYSKVRIWRTQ